MVEVSYALTPVGIVERTYDRSDRTTSYRVASWTSKLERWSESSGPWNTPPPKARWRNLTTNERRELGLDETIHHATKKKLPAQLDREIAELLSEHATMTGRRFHSTVSEYDPHSLPWRVVDARTGREIVRASERTGLYPISQRRGVRVEAWRDRSATWEPA